MSKDTDGLNPDQLQLYRESLFRALNNFYITIGQQKNQQELKTSVLKREDNINQLYNALKNKYKVDANLPAALKLIADFACKDFGNGNADCSLGAEYADPADAAASTANQWANPPQGVGQSDWEQILGQVYCEFRSTVCVPGDILFVWGEGEDGKNAWYKIELPPQATLQPGGSTSTGKYPYQPKDILCNYSTHLTAVPLAKTGADIKNLSKITGNGNQLLPLMSWVDDKNGRVLFAGMPGTDKNTQRVVAPNTDGWNILLRRFNQWMDSDLSAVKKGAPWANADSWEHIKSCFAGALSGTNTDRYDHAVPLLLALYNNWNNFEDQIIRSAFPAIASANVNPRVRGAITQWLYSIGSLALNCYGANLGAYHEATNHCGNVLRTTTDHYVPACSCFVRAQGGGWALNPLLLMSAEELQVEAAHSGVLNWISSWVWDDNVDTINHSAICSPGIWIFVDLPSMPHSLLVIIRNGVFFTIGVGAPEGQWRGSKPSMRSQAGGDSGKLIIHSPDESILSKPEPNHKYQFEGILPGDIVYRQNTRMIGYYNSGIQKRLQQVLVAASSAPGSITTGLPRHVQLTMPPSFGSYNTLSRGGWLWFLTGGVNCTSFTQWVSGTGVCGQILACPHGLVMKQNQLTCFPTEEFEGGKRKTRRRKHRKRTKHRRRRQKKTRHNKKKRKRRRRTRR